MTTLSDLLLLGTTLQTVPDPTNGGVQLPYPTSDHLVANLGKSIQALAEQLSTAGPGRIVVLPTAMAGGSAAAGAAASSVGQVNYPATPSGTLLLFDVSVSLIPSTAVISIANLAMAVSAGTLLGKSSRRVATPASGLAVDFDFQVLMRSNGSAGAFSMTAQTTSASAPTVTTGCTAMASIS